MKAIVTAGFVCIVCLTMPAQSVVYFNQSKWSESNIESLPCTEAKRILVKPNSQGNYGGMWKYFKKQGDNCYLQIELGDMESFAAKPWCSNVAKNGGGIGTLNTGINTFLMPEHMQGKGDFALRISQLGAGKKPGAWVDYKSVKFTLAPKNAPVVTLIEGNEAKVGSKLKIVYVSSENLAVDPIVHFVLTPNFVEYRFNKDNEITLKKVGDKRYSAIIEITNDALKFISSKAKKVELLAFVNVGRVNHYYKIPFKLNVETKNLINNSVISAATPEVRRNRDLWFKRAAGTDLARGKRVTFAPIPDYSLTNKDNSNAVDLTRGELSIRSDDKVWFDSKAVGWYFNGSCVRIKLDLNKSEPVEKVVIRLLGGTNGNFNYPAKLRSYVSLDGVNFYKTSEMGKLAPAESYQSDWKKNYYLDESANHPNTQMYPFELPIHADARYVVVELNCNGAAFSDALACIKAEEKKVDYNAAYKQRGIEIPMEGVIIRPKVSELAIMKGVPAPQLWEITDLRDKKADKNSVEMVIELPAGAKLIGGKGEKLANGGTRYCDKLVFRYGALRRNQTCYFEVSGPIRGKAVVYARVGGIDQFKTSLPIRLLEVPEIKPLKRLFINLGWMHEASGRMWPDFLNNWRHLGFNAVCVFPRYWTTKKSVDLNLNYVNAAIKAGFKIDMEDSPFHEMIRGKKAGHEVFCQLKDKLSKQICPSYEGEFYRKELERVKNCVKLSRPAKVRYDIECWHNVQNRIAKCSRCQEAIAKSGKSADEYLFSRGKQMLKDLKQAVKSGAAEAGIPMPVISFYNNKPTPKIYQITQWDDIYPGLVDYADISLYVSGRAIDVHNLVRKNYELMGNNKITATLTAGTYGEFEAYKIEHMVLEALLNGASDISYFQFSDFDSPLDYYYHAKALSAISPYEDLIMDGKVSRINASNKLLTYSMIVKENQALILIGNYGNAAPETEIEMPFVPNNIIDVRNGGKKITAAKGNKLKIQVAKSDICLLYIKK